MKRLCALPALALWSLATVSGQAPSYSAATVLNTCNQAHGPYAPNTGITILGSGMALSTRALTATDITDGALPTTLNGVEVMVDGMPAPLFYISPTQINFLMPPNQVVGPVTVWVVLNSIAGPQISITLQDAAPALFPSPLAPDYAIAQLWPAYSLIGPASPAPPAGIVILYATGLGTTEPYPAEPAEIPLYAGVIERIADFQVLLNGTPLDPRRVLYAGICPGWAGLYQINLVLPDDVGPNPEIRVAVGSEVSPAGILLAVEPAGAAANRATASMQAAGLPLRPR
jgi:uncharacterized protein (TIGR03437 family)